MLDKGASLESNSHFDALATAAVWNSNADTTKYLLDRGARDNNSSAISSAARDNKIDIVRVLLSHSPTQIPTGESGALHEASRMGHLDMVNLLLENNFDVNLLGRRSATPLHAACSSDSPNPDIVQVLLDHGADVAAQCIASAWEFHCTVGDTPCM